METDFIFLFTVLFQCKKVKKKTWRSVWKSRFGNEEGPVVDKNKILKAF